MLYVNSNEEEKSFKGLYLKYYDPIYNYIYRSVLNREASEDIISNVFFNAVNSIKKKNPRIDNFHAWIYKIATNEIIRFKKTNKAAAHLSLDDESIQLKNHNNSSDKNNNYNIDHKILDEELKKLNDIEKTLVTLHFFEDKSYSEISEILKININTLRPMMSRILKRLYHKLKFKIK